MELPYLHYMEIDSLRYDATKTGVEARAWSDVAGCASGEDCLSGNDESAADGYLREGEAHADGETSLWL